jgi:hypothetical protein
MTSTHRTVDLLLETIVRRCFLSPLWPADQACVVCPARPRRARSPRLLRGRRGGSPGQHFGREAPMLAGRHHASDMWQALAQAANQHRGRLGDSSEQARRRAALAWDVLAGRPAPRPWLPLAGAAVLGIFVGWAAAHVYRDRRPQLEQALSAARQQLRETTAAVQERISMAKAAPGGPVEKAKAVFTGEDGDDATDADGTADKPSKP